MAAATFGIVFIKTTATVATTRTRTDANLHRAADPLTAQGPTHRQWPDGTLRYTWRMRNVGLVSHTKVDAAPANDGPADIQSQIALLIDFITLEIKKLLRVFKLNFEIF